MDREKIEIDTPRKFAPPCEQTLLMIWEHELRAIVNRGDRNKPAAYYQSCLGVAFGTVPGTYGAVVSLLSNHVPDGRDLLCAILFVATLAASVCFAIFSENRNKAVDRMVADIMKRPTMPFEPVVSETGTTV